MTNLVFRFCKKCNAETERYESGNCKPCIISRRKAHREANLEIEKEKARKRMAAWRAANPEKSKQRQVEFYARNADRIKERQAKLYAADPVKFRERKNRRYAEKTEIVKGYVAKWKANNKDACRAHDLNRRANKLNNGGKLSKEIVEKLMKLQRGKCACCHLPLGDDFHIDHIMPLSRGGENTDQNVQLLRSKCNLQKNAKHPVDFMQQRGFLL